MASVKTAISLQEALLKKAEALARELKISRSRLFVMALEDYIRQHQNQRLLDQINAAYSDQPDQNEADRLDSMRRHQRRTLEGEW